MSRCRYCDGEFAERDLQECIEAQFPAGVYKVGDLMEATPFSPFFVPIKVCKSCVDSRLSGVGAYAQSNQPAVNP